MQQRRFTAIHCISRVLNTDHVFAFFSCLVHYNVNPLQYRHKIRRKKEREKENRAVKKINIKYTFSQFFPQFDK